MMGMGDKVTPIRPRPPQVFGLARRISRRLGSVPSLIWACVYLAAIPTFAAVYSLFPGGSWLYGTITHEQRYLEKENAFRMGMMKFNAQNVWGPLSDAALSTGLPVNNSQMWLEEDIHYPYTLPIGRIIVDTAKSSSQIRFHLEPAGMDRYNVLQFSSGASRQQPGFRIIADCESQQPYCAATRVQNGLRNDAFIAATDELVGLAFAVWQERDGINYATSKDTFYRMLYLSAVTITTVGYGDIVPLTDLARAAVASEAILGIVLIGLFLNALSHERD
jgi:hypothetical protein